jgi:hypothetical protein
MMHTITRTRLVAHTGFMKWRGTLATSVAFLLAAVRPTYLGHFGVGTQSQVYETGIVASRLTSPGVMLIESDVCQHFYGIVP